MTESRSAGARIFLQSFCQASAKPALCTRRLPSDPHRVKLSPPSRPRSRPARRAQCLALRLQSRQAALAARLAEPRHLRRATAVRCAALHRRLRSADRRHHRPTGHNRRSDSNCHWIKVGGNVTPPDISIPFVSYRAVSNGEKSHVSLADVDGVVLLPPRLLWFSEPWSRTKIPTDRGSFRHAPLFFGQFRLGPWFSPKSFSA